MSTQLSTALFRPRHIRRLDALRGLPTFEELLDEATKAWLAASTKQIHDYASDRIEETEDQNREVEKVCKEKAGLYTGEYATGYGKSSVLAPKVALRFLKIGKVIYVCPSRTSLGNTDDYGIIRKFSAAFAQYDGRYRLGSINEATRLNDVHFFTPAGLINLQRCERSLFEKLIGECHLLIVDEAHHCPRDPEGRLKIYGKIDQISEEYFLPRRKKVFTLTATHGRTDGMLVFGKATPDSKVTVQERVNKGRCPEITSIETLLPIRCPNAIPRGKDFDLGLSRKEFRLYWRTVAGHMIKVWKKFPKPTCAFVRTQREAIYLGKIFNKSSGLNDAGFGILLGTTPVPERQRIIQQIKEGERIGYITCNVGEESLDIPCIQVVHLIRRTQSWIKLIQSIGRALRLHPGKRSILVVDYHVNEARIIRACKGLADYAIYAGVPRSRKLFNGAPLVSLEGSLQAIPYKYELGAIRKLIVRNYGQTLDDVSGLLDEAAFAKASGVSLPTIGRYRREGRIVPEGLHLRRGCLVAYYKPGWIKRLRASLGVDLKSTRGLLSEEAFAKAAGVSQATVARNRHAKVLKPHGFAFGQCRRNAFYHPRQVTEFKKKLGITLESIQGLLREDEFARRIGISACTVGRWRKRGDITPFGYSYGHGARNAFYHTSQVRQFRKRNPRSSIDPPNSLDREPSFSKSRHDPPKGISRRSDKEFQNGLSEVAFADAVGVSTATMARARERGIAHPIQLPGRRLLYRHEDVASVKRALGVLTQDRSRLSSIADVAKIIGCGTTAVYTYRQRGWLKASATHLRYSFFSLDDVERLKVRLGITLSSVSGLIDEHEFARRFGVHNTTVKKYYRSGKLTPIGFALRNGIKCAYFRKKQIDELRKKLGVTAKGVGGLLSSYEFAKAIGRSVAVVFNYREKGLLKEYRRGLGHGHPYRYFFHRSQVKQLLRKLGVASKGNRSLLSAREIAKRIGVNRNTVYGLLTKIRPAGRCFGTHGLVKLYDPRVVPRLRNRHGYALDEHEAAGLLSETEFEKLCRRRINIANIAVLRRQRLIKPIGQRLKGKSARWFYHPRQIDQVKRLFGITLEDTAGLFTEEAAAKACGVHVESIQKLRRRRRIVPFGRGGRRGRGYMRTVNYYDRQQIAKLRELFGVTLDNTDGLVREAEIARLAGLRPGTMCRLRQSGVLQPRGYFGTTSNGPIPYYDPSQADELRRTLGATLRTRAGLLGESSFSERVGVARTTVAKYRRLGKITPAGTWYRGAGEQYYYSPKQVAQFKTLVASQ